MALVDVGRFADAGDLDGLAVRPACDSTLSLMDLRLPRSGLGVGSPCERLVKHAPVHILAAAKPQNMQNGRCDIYVARGMADAEAALEAGTPREEDVARLVWAHGAVIAFPRCQAG